MAEVTKPIALDESFNTTENTSRNVADVLAEGLDNIAEAVVPRAATQIPIQSGSATNTKDYIDTGLSGKADSTAVNNAFATIGDIKVSTLSAGNKSIGDIQTWAKSEGKGLFWGTAYMTSPFSGWGVYWVYNRIVASAYSEIIIFQNDHIVTSFTQNLDSTTPTWTTKSGSLA